MRNHVSLQISYMRKGWQSLHKIEIMQSVVTARQDGAAMDLCL